MPDIVFLVALDGELSGQRFPLKSPLLVGRGPYNHVVIDDARISRQHSKISPEPGGYVLYDLNSVNGTFVNDVPVRRKKLEPNDVIRFGPLTFRFERGSSPDMPVHGVPASNRIVEFRTRKGMEPPAEIVGSVDASSASSPGAQVGLNQLEDAYHNLRTLYGFMQSICTTLDTREMLEHIGRDLLDVFTAADCVRIFLRDPESGSMVLRISLPYSDGVAAEPATLPEQVRQEVLEKARAILTAPPASGSGRTRGLSMYAPMMYREQVQGVIHVVGGYQRGARFLQSDLDLLTGMAAPAAMALQNARMHQESLKQERLQHDLLLAEQIQKSFLPRHLPSVRGIEFLTEYRPAYSVGGDFYDVFWVTPERLGVFVGDVSGKGVSAALLMARISSDLRVAALAETEPAKALATVNRLVLERQQHDIFFTAVYFTLDVRSGEVVLANAGHPPPFLRRHDGSLEQIDDGGGCAVGILDDAEFAQTVQWLTPGDSIVLYTDGVLEATNSKGQQFGPERLEECVAIGSPRASLIAERLLGGVRRHVGDAPQNDDLTLLICSRIDPLGESTRPARSESTQVVATENAMARRPGG